MNETGEQGADWLGKTLWEPDRAGTDAGQVRGESVEGSRQQKPRKQQNQAGLLHSPVTQQPRERKAGRHGPEQIRDGISISET